MTKPQRVGSSAAVAAAVVAGLAGLGLAAPSSVAAAPAPQSGTGVPIMVVMDTSGSMGDPAGTGGVIKIDAARAAVSAVASAVGSDQQLGLIAYPGASKPAGADGCEPGDVLLPLGPADPALTSAAVRHLTPNGQTPTSAALDHAAQLLTATGAQHSVIVLVSDGQANCGPPVCDTAKKLLAQGVSLTINTVGFDLAHDDAARADLKCVATATGGAYADAGDAQALREALLRAASSYLEIDATIPKETSGVTGTSAALGVDATIKVTNTGTQEARDVQASLDFAQGNTSGVVPIDKPVQSAGNLAPGASRVFTFRLRPPPVTTAQKLDWIAAATTADGRGAQEPGTMTVQPAGHTLGPVLSVKGPVAVVGDSYSAGEGARDYYAKPWQPCHRSVKAYAEVLFPHNVTNLACSGAVTANYGMSPQVVGPMFHHQQVTLQSVQVQALADSTRPPALVLLTFGGNDIGFKYIVTNCVLIPGCNYTEGEGDLAKVPTIANDLAAVYEQVDTQVNSADDIRKRHGQVAPIVVLPYVRILPQDDSNAPGNCFVGFDPGEVRFLNQLTNKLNDTIRSVVQYEVDAGRPLYYASDVIEAFQPDHSICAPFGSQDANTSRNWQVPLPLTPAQRAELFATAALRAKLSGPELAHPNADGYRAEAEALAGWSQHAQLLPVTGPPAPNISVTDHPLPGGVAIGVGQLQPAGASLTVQGGGFQPGSQVVVRLQSFPRVTGSGTVADNGTVAASAAIPYDTPPGAHHLVLEGFGPDGRLKTVTMPLRVLPPWSDEAVLVLLLGLALLVGGALSGRQSVPSTRHRRRRSL